MPRKKNKTLLDDLGLVTKSQLAVILSAEAGREITLRQVWAWCDRRANNLFPDPEVIKMWRGRPTGYFDPDKVVEWFRHYVPDKGGRPHKAA